MGKTAGRARFARIGIAVAVLVVLAGIGVALAATVGGLAPAGGPNALVVEEPASRPQDTLEAEPAAPTDAAAEEAPAEEAAPPAPTPPRPARLKSSAPSSPMPPASRCSCAASPPTVWPGTLST